MYSSSTVDGQWGAWSNHNCDRTCRGYKTRRCDSPPPLRGGGYCEGTNRDEYGDCTGHECVENGRCFIATWLLDQYLGPITTAQSTIKN